jgi:hypothetical protein
MLKWLGTDAIAARLKDLTDRLIGGLIPKGYHIVSPRSGEQWSRNRELHFAKHDHDNS